MQGDVIGCGENIFQRGQLDLRLARHFRRHERIVRHQLHAEGACPARYLDADAAEAHDPEGFAAQLGALQRFLFPLAGVHQRVGAAEVTRHGQRHRHGVLGDRHGVGARRVHDRDAEARRGLQVHVVHADAGAPDDAQLLRVLQQGGVRLHGGAHDQRVGIGDLTG